MALSMLALGAFIGALITGFYFKIPPDAQAGKILAGLIGGALGPGTMGFIQFISNESDAPIGEAIYYYPIGLGYGMLLVYLRAANENIAANETSRKVLGWLQVGAVGLASFLLLLLFLSPDFKSLVFLADSFGSDPAPAR